MNHYKYLIINASEIWIKKRNQKKFYKLLRDHLKHRTKYMHDHPFKLNFEGHRFILESEVPFSEKLLNILLLTPGIRNIEPVLKCSSTDLQDLLPLIKEELKELGDSEFSFKAHAKRADKRYPMTSMEAACEVGAIVLKNFPNARVNIKNPDKLIRLKILQSGLYLSVNNFEGLSGLPVGSAGRILSLLSGGFDSPVASVMMGTRGTDLSLVFFHAYPFVGDEVKNKIKELSKAIAKTQRYTTLHIVPFGKVQQKIADFCHEKFRTLLIRKAMVEGANLLADLLQIKALVTGDALSQVSSQTLENICFVDKASRRPILRPLIGMTKEEIIKRSVRYGTHDISIIPHDDACALFAAENPVIHASEKHFDFYEKNIKLDEVLAEALNKTEHFHINYQGEIQAIKIHEDGLYEKLI